MKPSNLVKPSNLAPLKFADAEKAMRHVFVRDLIIDGYIGIYDHEKQAPQKLCINVDLSVRENAHPLNDDINNVLCYEKIVRNIQTIVGAGHIHLVETLAEQIADMSLQDSRVVKVRVRVEKLEAIPNTTSVGVEIERARRMS
ncbi:dihydroneopterin aldolase [Luteithermobacter gelatinilyticus]|uniref:dihydroneopterin aldolase n=1 Tax=Luteithermobacter gelatinilyticus TaxID=2582913 RepID=UPI001105AD8C|nr:dihydroneopterin aldolase [Luteithermobacter gelatinilyticus]|tara:strand:+ start:9933 stop:10361 length:429 start_codon:yes stop_codon:yes gene_type:complete